MKQAHLQRLAVASGEGRLWGGQKEKEGLESQCQDLHNDKHVTKMENTRLKLTNQELHRDAESTSQELLIAQQQLQMLQDEAKKLQEEKEMLLRKREERAIVLRDAERGLWRP
uniref:Uncharacterized protein n=1 Tax=Sphaerodactylus townsendi TaxID=933632 RepID=A0ACB8E6B5_9SAUR